MRINTNIMALNAQRNLSATGVAMAKSIEKLSSGLRINRAADDAAGLSISEKLRAQVRGLAQAQRNAQDGISMIQTGEGALNEVHSMLQRMRELGLQAANDTLSNDDRKAINAELKQLQAEINAISTRTQFNGKGLLDGSTTAANFQIGSNSTDFITVAFNAVDTTSLNLDTALTNFDTAVTGATGEVAAAQGLVDAVDAAITSVNDTRSTLGAVQNRLEHTIASLGVAHENLSASESRIRDVDMAEEVVNMTRNQILQQAGTAVLAQANQVPQSVLSLLR